MYYTAAVLDPRIKTTLIEEQYREEAAGIIKHIKDYLKHEHRTPAPLSIAITDIELPYSASIYQLGLLRRARRTEGLTASDIDRYLDEPTIDWDETDLTNYRPDWVLDWWKANQFQYPLMAEAGRDLLAVPGSEVDVERLFSGRRDALGTRRHPLKGEAMRILTLLKAYFERQIN